MRYAVIIPDGAADRPRPSLGDKTPLEVADIPNMDRLAREGRLGLAATVPEGMKPGSDVANLSILGYDPAECYTGRAPLEAASLNISLAEGEAAFRANTVIVEDGMMKDYAGGHITTEESTEMVLWLNERLGIAGARLYPGVSYRHICVFENITDDIPDRSPPHDILDLPAGEHLPQGKNASRLLQVEERTRELLPECPVNIRRREAGKAQVTQLWMWGGGVMPSLKLFRDLYNVGGGLISAVDLLRGISVLAGLEVIKVPGATGYYDTNYVGKGEAALECLSRSDLVVVHVEAPDEAGHNGEEDEKIRAIENIDRHVVGPVLAEAEKSGDIRILCMPDHPTPIELRTHSSEPIPFALWGPGFAAEGGAEFTEKAAAGAEVVKASGLMGILTGKCNG